MRITMNDLAKREFGVTYPFDEADAYHDGLNYAIEFNLPNGQPVRLMSGNLSTLVGMANEMYQKKAKEFL